MPQAVHRGGVDPVHSEIKRAMDGADGFAVILRTPGKLPARAADRPGAVTDACDVKIRFTKLPRLHFCSPQVLDSGALTLDSDSCSRASQHLTVCSRLG